MPQDHPPRFTEADKTPDGLARGDHLDMPDSYCHAGVLLDLANAPHQATASECL